MNKPLIVVGLFAIAGSIAFHAWLPVYLQTKTSTSHEELACQARMNVQMERTMNEFFAAKSDAAVLAAAEWANCDSASLYPNKHGNCTVVVLGSDED